MQAIEIGEESRIILNFIWDMLTIGLLDNGRI